jgi:hypothetical protein
MPVEAFPAAIATSVLVSYYLFLHDLSVLLIPMAVLLDRQTQPGFAHDERHHVAGWIAFSAFVAPLTYPFVPQYRYLISLPVCALLFVLVWQCRRNRISQGPHGSRQQSADACAFKPIEAP